MALKSCSTQDEYDNLFDFVLEIMEMEKYEPIIINTVRYAFGVVIDPYNWNNMDVSNKKVNGKYKNSSIKDIKFCGIILPRKLDDGDSGYTFQLQYGSKRNLAKYLEIYTEIDSSGIYTSFADHTATRLMPCI